jgi:hypothetical protein
MSAIMRTLSIVPAYGRQYISHRSALADWNLGKDFKISHGPYLSIRDEKALMAEGYTGVSILSGQGYSTVLFSAVKETA